MLNLNKPIFLSGIIVFAAAAAVGGWFMLSGDDARDLSPNQNNLIDRSDSGKCDPACKDDEVCQRSEIKTGHFRDNFPEVLVYYNCRKIACPEGAWRGDTESACPASACGQAETCQPIDGTYIADIGSCRNCQPFCNNPESYVSYNDCKAACGEKCEEDFDTKEFPKNCWTCPKFTKDEVGQTPVGDSSKITPPSSSSPAASLPAPETPLAFWEFLDIDAGWGKVPNLPIGHQVHLIVASNGIPDIRTFLPIKIELKVNNELAWQSTISGDPQQVCRDATGCSIDGPAVEAAWQGKTIELRAYAADGSLLANYAQ